jgi:hypothetical protein
MGTGSLDIADTRSFFRTMIDLLHIGQVPRSVKASYLMAAMNLQDNQWCRSNIDLVAINQAHDDATFYNLMCQRFIDGENGHIQTEIDIEALMAMRYDQQSKLDYPAWVRQFASSASLAQIRDDDQLLILHFISTQPTIIKQQLRLNATSAGKYVSLRTLFTAANSVACSYDAYKTPPIQSRKRTSHDAKLDTPSSSTDKAKTTSTRTLDYYCRRCRDAGIPNVVFTKEHFTKEHGQSRKERINHIKETSASRPSVIFEALKQRDTDYLATIDAIGSTFAKAEWEKTGLLFHIL